VLSEPPGQFDARTRLARGVSLVVGAPQPAPAGVEEHRVAGPHVEPGPGKRLLGVSHRDDITWAEPFGTPGGNHVQQQPPGHHLRKGVDTELAGAVVLYDVSQPEPVVGAVADPQMVQPVHVGAHLLGRGDPLDDPVDFVAPKASRTRVGAPLAAQVVAGGQTLLEGAAGKGRDVLVQHVGQVVGPPPANQPDRLEHLVRGDLVQRTGLVVRAVLRGPPPAGPAGRCLRLLRHADSVPPRRRTFHGPPQPARGRIRPRRETFCPQNRLRVKRWPCRPTRELGVNAMTTQHYDVIIIGTGAGGGTLAHKLAPSGKRVLLLERGGYLPREPENWDSREVFINDRYLSGEFWYDKDGRAFKPHQQYFVGGNTKFYGAVLFR